MPIRFYCEACTSRIKVPDGTEGKLVKCPGCGHAQRVPNEPAEEPPEPTVAAEPVKARKTTKSAPVEAKSKEPPQASKPESSPVAANDLNEGATDDELDSDHDPVELAAESPQADEADTDDEALDETEEAWDDEPADEALEERVDELEDGLEEETVAPNWSEESPVAIEYGDVHDGGDANGDELDQDRVVTDDAPPDEIKQAEVWPAEEQTSEPMEEQVYPVATPVAHVRTSGAREFGTRRRRHDRDGTSSANGRLALLIVGWMLRVLAVFSVAGVVKTLLLMSDGGASVIDMLFVAPLLLGLVATFWAVSELSLSWHRQSRE